MADAYGKDLRVYCDSSTADKENKLVKIHVRRGSTDTATAKFTEFTVQYGHAYELEILEKYIEQADNPEKIANFEPHKDDKPKSFSYYYAIKPKLIEDAPIPIADIFQSNAVRNWNVKKQYAEPVSENDYWVSYSVENSYGKRKLFRPRKCTELWRHIVDGESVETKFVENH
jgi:hypothetical protein